MKVYLKDILNKELFNLVIGLDKNGKDVSVGDRLSKTITQDMNSEYYDNSAMKCAKRDLGIKREDWVIECIEVREVVFNGNSFYLNRISQDGSVMGH